MCPGLSWVVWRGKCSKVPRDCGEFTAGNGSPVLLKSVDLWFFHPMSYSYTHSPGSFLFRKSSKPENLREPAWCLLFYFHDDPCPWWWNEFSSLFIKYRILQVCCNGDVLSVTLCWCSQIGKPICVPFVLIHGCNLQ